MSESGNDDLEVAAPDITVLKLQRSAMKRNITNLKNKIEKEGRKADGIVLDCQLQILESYFKQLCHVQTQIERSCPTDEARGDLEELFIGAKTKLLHLLNAKPRTSISELSMLNATTNHSFQQSRLPTLTLPKFSGKYLDYSRFMHTFESLVHEDSSLSVIDKFNYLLDCLSGSALAVVEPFQVEEGNYQKALDRLKERFDNKALIFTEHINALKSLPAMERDDATSLRSLVDRVISIKASLLSLGTEKNVMEALLINLITSKLDGASKQAYDDKQDFQSFPCFKQCCDILNRRCQFLEGRAPHADSLNSTSSPSKQRSKRTSKSFIAAKSVCACCNAPDHAISRCNTFNAMLVPQRFEFVKQNSLCINCLCKGHGVSKCASQSRCRSCNGLHHTMLHRNARPQVTKSPSGPQLNADAQSFQLASNPPSTQLESQRVATSLLVRRNYQAILPTAIVLVKDGLGLLQPVRVLLDSCSEINFITLETAKRLHLKQTRTCQMVSGISDIHTNIEFEVEATIKSRLLPFQWTSNFAVSKTISSNQPSESIDTITLKLPKNIELADPIFNKPQKIDMLLGAELFFDLIMDGKMSCGEDQPMLINTKLGWIVGGKLNSDLDMRASTCNVTTRISLNKIDDTLKRFWEIEEYQMSSCQRSRNDTLVEQHYVENTTFAADGRVQVRLPFNQSNRVLGDSFQMAHTRFLALERRLQRDPNLETLYVQFMEEYMSLGHMSPVHNLNVDESYYIIPHHSILRMNNTSSKLRVVFDASACTSSNCSLNELLMVGPTIQQDLITTLLAFRLNKFALTADICKMYRQFWVHSADRRFQLIFWRSNRSHPLQLYALNTITYGTSAAPFLAVRSLQFIADAHRMSYPVGAHVLTTDLYVDDVLTGADTYDELQIIKDELTELLATAKLQLAKWNSNHLQLFEDSAEEVQFQSMDSITTTLGMAWKPQLDVFCFRIQITVPEVPTKRSVLSLTSKIYDLLGLLGPVVIRLKILLQQMWIQRLAWDDPLPISLKHVWSEIIEDLPNINSIEVPRFVFTSKQVRADVHGFADASERAYGCCLYIRTLHNEKHKITLLIAKSKVAPLKAQSLPRLELCAALLLVRTWKKFQHKLVHYIENVHFWSDSKTVLLWLRTHSSQLNSFVANRVSEIQANSHDITWHHVPGKENPADIISRGCSASKLPTTIWFTGPNFLTTESNMWPTLEMHSQQDVTEFKKTATFCCSKMGNANPIVEEIINRNSSYVRILHVVAYIHRIFNKVHPSNSSTIKTISPITCNEVDDAFHFIVATIQQTQFSKEIKELEINRPLQPSLQRLSPFLFEISTFNKGRQLMRVGGRLAQAPIPVEAKFPILLPKNHRFTTLYVEHLHRTRLHAGPKVLIGLVRQRVWIINAREVVRRVVRNCVHCFKYRPKLMQQIMGNMPADRFKAQRPFLICGVDFCGPFLTSARIRSKVPYKTYIAIFVCFSSKAVHMELVSDLTTNSFLGCLKRFVGRRGIPQRLYCDNATNFVGAHNKLKELYQQFFDEIARKKLTEFCVGAGFEFRFIPPRSPHFGGLWEAAVKSAKTILLKNISLAHLSFEELHTIIVEVESILNSRPLTAKSDDPNDGEALTPSHLIIGTHLYSIPEPSLNHIKSSYLSRWQHITFLKQQFWQQWVRDYVLDLQQRSKWLTDQTNLKRGQLVLVHDDNLPPQRWLLARITTTIPGPDGRVRVVDLKTTKGTLRRAIQRLAPLPIQV